MSEKWNLKSGKCSQTALSIENDRVTQSEVFCLRGALSSTVRWTGAAAVMEPATCQPAILRENRSIQVAKYAQPPLCKRTDCPLRTIANSCCLNSSSHLRRTSFVGRVDEFGSHFFTVVSLSV